MQLETFRGPDLTALFREARTALGEDVLIVSTRVQRSHRVREYEVVTTTPKEVARLRARIEAYPLPSVQQHRVSGRPPYVLALVGAAGAGKTTALATLAMEVDAFSEWTVGVLALSEQPGQAMQRLAAMQVLQDCPIEVVSRPDDIDAALARLGGCEAILVDTPGRGLRLADDGASWARVLGVLAPDETHLVVPATADAGDAVSLLDTFHAYRPTHALVSKHDEAQGDDVVAVLAAALDLPIRWVTASPDPRAALRSGASQILGGMSIDAPPSRFGGSAW